MSCLEECAWKRNGTQARGFRHEPLRQVPELGERGGLLNLEPFSTSLPCFPHSPKKSHIHHCWQGFASWSDDLSEVCNATFGEYAP